VVFVSHDFGVVAQLCDSVTVMYAGQIVEHGATEDIIEAPRHPYTQMLLRCHPDHSDVLTSIPGSVSSPTDPPPGCRFAPRCESRRPECSEARPAPIAISAGREVHCVLYRS
jgi:oligopeptide/dipeptide ABC transporter ATP-binding protein